MYSLALLAQSHLGTLRLGMLRVYCIAIAVLVMAVETEHEMLLAQMRVLDSWVGRGLLQVRKLALVWCNRFGQVSWWGL